MEWHDTISVNILSFIYNDDLRLRQMLIYSMVLKERFVLFKDKLVMSPTIV